MDTPVRVVLVEDHPMFRVGLTATLGLTGDIAVVACAATEQEAGALVAEHRPDVVVLDIGLPDGTGIALIPRLRAESRASHILMLTSYDDASIHAALRAGVRGYVVKTADPDDIVRAVRTVATGAGHFSPTVVDRITTHVATGGRSSDHSTIPQLTRREREIWR
ncbi:hypothetical protein GCM10009557_42520 [Virgisporangium ochraceum]|uniref:Response regulatory domain-containing protein n=1 Tax=Virgisporangium ochraceum TaxID=65505 RepID=A0A8J4EKE1_9ACTN|nr:response regulator transcription factor [Virgisporangium ochraceum]GIJ75282.1 hypothetical protein Voc01_101990 [Virgisporangium ochraceum]